MTVSQMNRLWANDPILINKLDEMEKRLVANETGMSRIALLSQMFDPRRDVDNECGYPKNTFWSADQYQDLYEREPVANRAIQLFPKEAWQRSPTIAEDEDSRHLTEFEQAVQDFSQKLSASSWHTDTTGTSLWEHCHRANTLCRIGSFGLILIGLDDGKDLSEPVDGMVTVNRKLEAVYKVDDDGDPVLNSQGKPIQVGVRVTKVGDELPVLPDGPVLRDELKALREPKQLSEEQQKAGVRQWPTLNVAEQKRVDTWERGWVEDAPVYAKHEEIVVNKVATTFSDLTATGQQSIQGTDQQYFGVQFGPTQQPADEPSKKEHDVIFMQEFGEPLVQIVRYEWNIRNPRFGMPVMYRVTLNDPRQVHSGVGLPLATVFVHWSRVIHVHDSYSNPGSSRIFAYPALMPILNPVLDIKKTRGASAEAYWKNCLASLSLETHPQLGGDVDVDKLGLKDMLEQKNNGLQRDIILTGMTAKTLSPQAIDPTPYVAIQIEAICIQLGCPIRVFKGAERGELASSQDDADWNDRVMGYCNGFCTPYIIAPLFDRLIMFGALPEPESYTVKWPDPEALGEQDKATVGLTITQAIQAYIAGDVKSLIDVEDYLVGILGMDQDKVKEWVKNAQKAAEQEQDDAQDMADEHGFEPQPPEGFQKPPPEPPPGGGFGGAKPPVENEEFGELEAAWNRFCATGPGGGQDNSCGKDDNKSGEVEKLGHVAHEAEHAAHLGHAASAHGHFDTDATAIVVGKLVEPAAKAVGAVMERVPGARNVANSVAKLHDGAVKIAEAAVQKAIARYGHGAVSAALGAGGFATSAAAHAAGIPGSGALGKAAKYVGAIPLMALAEVGRAAGVVGQGTRLDRGLTRISAKIAAIKHAVGRKLHEVAHLVAGSIAAGVGAIMNVGDATPDIANEVLTDFFGQYNLLVTKHSDTLKDGEALFDELDKQIGEEEARPSLYP
jgi:hypothetical protein